jgi:hypothetical protein
MAVAAAKRALLALALVAGMVSVVGAQNAAADVLDYGCSPPLPVAHANCAGWHTTAVTLRWKYDTFLYDPVSGTNCDQQVFSSDTPGTAVTCGIAEVGNPANTYELGLSIKVDTTPPTTTGAAPDRPPDYNGWWNHPVTFAFSGTDATSGIAACDTLTYSGPDGAVASVTGGCRDVAGNSSSLTVPVKYDATPPSVSDADAAPGDASARISWHPSSDVVRTEVARTPGDGNAASTRVFDGSTSNFNDVGLVNGVSYSYRISVFDDAGNSAAATATVVPAPPPASGSQAASAVRASTPPLLRWPSIKRARYYNVQLFRGSHKILSAWPGRARLQLRERWRFHGRRYRLVRGRYQWYVWPGYGPRAARRYGALVRKGTFYYRP